jgi:cysteine-rich repeat protein
MRSVAIALAMLGCVDAASVSCPEGNTCPGGTVCFAVTDIDDKTFFRCVTPSDVAACDDPFAMTCELSDGTQGACYAGDPAYGAARACLVGGCGNGIHDVTEVCDDANVVIGDGCSRNCESNETCGNGITDVLIAAGGGEQCDDARLLAHDGCTSTCRSETEAWNLVDVFGIQIRSERVDHGMAYDIARRKMVLFGGGNEDGTLLFSDTWESDGKQWVKAPTTIGPSPRGRHAMAYDATRHRIVLYGGQAGTGVLQDLWEWNGTSWELISTVNDPGPCGGHAMTYDSIAKRVVVVGCGDFRTWEWDGVRWTQRSLLAAIPPPSAVRKLVRISMAFDPVRGVHVALLAVDDNNVPRVEMWELADQSWQQSGDAPDALSIAALAHDPLAGRVIAVAADLQSNTLFTYGWSPLSGFELLTVATPPPARRRIALATDWLLGEVWMHGGTDLPGGQTWRWSDTWTQHDDQGVIPALAYPATTYDPIRGTAISFGGSSPTGSALRNLFEFDGQSVAVFTVAGPSGRLGSTLTFDPLRRESVLFGGQDRPLAQSLTVFGDTFVWRPHPTGAPVWQQHLGAGPSPRALHAAAYDLTRQRVVLFGGLGDGGAILDDTWEWDGSSWTQVTVSSPPIGRYAHSMVFDPRRGRVVVFGGLTTNLDLLSDLYEWTGTEWKEITTEATPPPRSGAVVQFNATAGRLTMFGGFNTISFFDVWHHDGVDWSAAVLAAGPDARAGAGSFSSTDGAHTMVFGGTVDSYHAGNTTNPRALVIPELWRLGHDSLAPYEMCAANVDNDGDELSGCADPDCWVICTPLCPPDAASCDPVWPRCGDGTCDQLENCRNCGSDCGCVPICGDSICDPGEACVGDCS